MTKDEIYNLLPFADPVTNKELVALIQAENYPGIDNQMKTHLYGPWLEFDFSPEFQEALWDLLYPGTFV